MHDIVKEKLVELIVEAMPPCYSDVFATHIADNLIANGVTVQGDKDINVPSKWISVKDRLPQVGLDVLFVCENKQYGVGAYSDTYRDFFSGQFSVKNVTHWMPLPQPPKGE